MIPLAAAIAARTKKIRIGTFVLLMPLHNPLHVAEDAATIDVLSNGRFDLGLGQGYVAREFTAFNVPREERSRRLREGVEIVRRAFTEENFSFEGRCYTVRDVTLYPRPVQQPHPPIWIGARSRPATERAARNGYHLAGFGERGRPRPTGPRYVRSGAILPNSTSRSCGSASLRQRRRKRGTNVNSDSSIC